MVTIGGQAFWQLQIKNVTSEGKESLYGVDAQHLMVLNSGSDLPVSAFRANRA